LLRALLPRSIRHSSPQRVAAPALSVTRAETRLVGASDGQRTRVMPSANAKSRSQSRHVGSHRPPTASNASLKRLKNWLKHCWTARGAQTGSIHGCTRACLQLSASSEARARRRLAARLRGRRDYEGEDSSILRYRGSKPTARKERLQNARENPMSAATNPSHERAKLPDPRPRRHARELLVRGPELLVELRAGGHGLLELLVLVRELGQ